MKAFKPYLMHILEECEYLESGSKDLKFEDFLKDEKNKISKLREKEKEDSGGNMTEKSDIDVVVEFEKGKATFKNVCGLVDFLEELFGREVDILTLDGIDSIRIKHVREKIKREIEYV